MVGNARSEMGGADLDLGEDFIQRPVLLTHVAADRAAARVGEGAEALVEDFGKFRIAHGLAHGGQHEKDGEFIGQCGMLPAVILKPAIKIRMAVQSRIKVTSLNVHRVIDEHLRILEALHGGDAARTRDALALHLDNSLKLALGVAVD
jgi:hypothetical protein